MVKLFDRWRRRTAVTGTATAAAQLGLMPSDRAEMQRWLTEERHGAILERLEQLPTEAQQTEEVLNLRTKALMQAKRFDAALEALDAALPVSSHPAQTQLEMARCLVATLDIAAAMDALEVAVALDPEAGDAWLLLGELKVRMDLPAEAAEPLAQATSHCQGDQLVHARLSLGRLLLRQGKLEKALEQLRGCLAEDPKHVNALIVMGDALLMLDREHEAIEHYQTALDLLPVKDPGVLLNMAVAQQQIGELVPARRAFEQVLALQPGSFTVRWYLCQLDLLECRWPQAWVNYPARLGMNPVHYRPLPFKRWGGEIVRDDTLLVIAGEGIGDEIMYASCIAEAIARVGHCIIDCDSRLAPLFRRSFPSASVVSSERDNSLRWLEGLPRPDWQIPSSDLPPLFRHKDEDFPRHSGYLQANEQRTAYWRSKLIDEHGERQLKVGISWRGGTSKTRTSTRSISPEQWAPILGCQGVTFVNLQYGDCAGELQEFRDRYGPQAITHYPDALADYDETAALVGSLDLVVTVCTAIVHLSGALGRPVWILTPHSPAWRYTAHRLSMPWYPSSRIFRQTAWGDWDSACQELTYALNGLTRNVTPIPTGS